MITIVGSGNVAFHLATAFSNVNIPIENVVVRDSDRGKSRFGSFALTENQDLSSHRSSIIVLAIADHAIEEVLSLYKFPQNAILAHTAGSIPIDVFGGLEVRGYGCLYPLQSLSATIPVDYQKIPIYVEGSSPKTTKELLGLAQKISQFVAIMDSQTRLIAHLSGVIVNNFANHLCAWADQLLRERGLDFRILHPLWKETYEKVMQEGPASAQTGPAIRNDHETVQKHLDVLPNERSKQIYKAISEQIIEFHRHSGQ